VSYGTLLRDARRDAGLDQSTLARRAGTTQTYISRVERGEVSPSVGTMQRLVRAIGLELVLSLRPLEPGNARPEDLRADFERLTAGERTEQAMELSEFLTGLAAEGTSRD